MRQPIRKDPSGSKSVERAFQKGINGLILKYREACHTFIVKNHGRSLAAPPIKIPISTADLIDSIKQLADFTIGVGAPIVAETAAIMSYNQGVKWADKTISALGVPKFEQGVSITKPFYLPPEKRAIERIKSQNLMEINGMTDELSKRMSRSLVEGFEKSETMNKLIRRVNEVTEFGKGRAEVIARTETMRAVNGAAVDRYRQNNIEKVEFLAAWDDRTCEECESKHGTVYDIGDAPYLPIHPQCRCTLAPVVESD